ncbi:tetratricopeptide repeat protein [Myxococcota bacterium]|jgi:tetratricopeptide (TPR) repeat protein|nr:tetratricopeptide repeat protein [Myxococcota bacterium]
MKRTRLLIGLCTLTCFSSGAMAAPAATGPTNVAELTDIREIGALDQKTLDEAEAVFFDGLGHYRAGRFEAAAQAFQKAHALTRHRDMLFNVARSRERMGDIPGAVEWYRAYLATQPADETAVIHKVRQLGAEPVAQAPAAAPTEEPVEVETIERGPGPWPWIAAGVGVAALAGGAVMGFQALGEAQSARDAEIRSTASKHKDTAESRALVADICFGTAALAAGTAVFLWWRADAEAAGAGRIDVGMIPGGGALGYSGRF